MQGWLRSLLEMVRVAVEACSRLLASTRSGWLPALALAWGCNQLAGVDDLHYQGGTGGAPSSSSSSTTGSGGRDGGAGGGAGGGAACSLYESGGCGPDGKCTIVDVPTGTVGCGLAGSKAPWDRCNTDSDCQEGAWCDPLHHVCKPWCLSMADCASDEGAIQGECVVARQSDELDIPGQPTHCISNCEPISGAPCAITDSVTCIFLGSGMFDCTRSNNHVVGSACTTAADCEAGLACVGTPAPECKPWCTPPAILGCGTTDCVPLSPAVHHGGAEYGCCN